MISSEIFKLHEEIRNCKKCLIHKNGFCFERSSGTVINSVMIIGEAPGYTETLTGKAFTGRSGKLLDSWLNFLEIKDYVITNVVKHRPDDNRKPTEEEIKNCRPFLDYEINYYKPKIILLLGATASQTILNIDLNITEVMKKSLSSGFFYNNIPVMVLYHPSYTLRTHIEPMLQEAKDFLRTLGL